MSVHLILVLGPVVGLDPCKEELVLLGTAVHSASCDLKFMELDRTIFVAPFVGPDCSFISLHWTLIFSVH